MMRRTRNGNLIIKESELDSVVQSKVDAEMKARKSGAKNETVARPRVVRFTESQLISKIEKVVNEVIASGK